MSSPKPEHRSHVDEFAERVKKDVDEIKKRFDDLVKAIEEDRKRLLSQSQGK